MARPGTVIRQRDLPPPRSAPTDTGVFFAAGMADKGSITEARAVSSMTEFVKHYGDRVSYSLLYDAIDTFFREGGNKAYLSRVVGPAPVTAGVTLNDAGAAATLRVNANSPGDWGNSLNIQVVAGGVGGSFVLVVSHDALGELERSPDLVDKAAAFSWAQYSSYIALVDQASVNDPAVVAAQSFVGGADDRNNATETQWLNAINVFTADLGPGQVAMPGRTTATAHANLLAHAAARRRVALLDAADTFTAATLKAAAASARTVDARYGAFFAPWVKYPGLTAGTIRLVPPSALVAGVIARNDPRLTPNVPAAGINGQSVFALGVSQAKWDDLTREDLNDDGVNVIRTLYGGVRIYGYRSLVDPIAVPNWINFGNSRLYMDIANRADIIAERYVLAEIDGRGIVIGKFDSDLTALLMPYWNAGSLYGLTPDEAFFVDTGPGVNTPETIANNELRAVISLKMSPMAELVTIEIVKRFITERVV